MQTRNVSMLDCIERVPSLVKAIFENRENTQKELFCYLGEEGLSRLSGIVFVGSGTSSTSGTTAAYFANKVAGVPVSAVVPSDFCYHTYHYDPDTLYVFISQTGTSKLTKQAMDLVKAKGYHCVCVSESKDTPMAKEAPCFLDMGCGYEEYPMRTIGYSTTVFTLQMLALEIGRRKGAVSDADYAAYCEEAKRLPGAFKPGSRNDDGVAAKEKPVADDPFTVPGIYRFGGTVRRFARISGKSVGDAEDDIRRPGARRGHARRELRL